MSSTGSFNKDKKRKPGESDKDSNAFDSEEQFTNRPAAEWWNQSQTRRKNMGTLVAFGVGTVIVGGVIINEIMSEDEEEIEQDTDSLQLQQKEGWNIGADDTALKFPGTPVNQDSEKNPDWKSYLNPSELLKAYQPNNNGFTPYVVPTLVQSLSSKSLANNLKLYSSPSIDSAYSEGLGMRDIFTKAKNPENTLYVVDIPGPESVAFGAALADVAEPVITFDNWPHPLGVVSSHCTLSELVFFAREVKEKSAERPKNAPAVFLLDRNRFKENIQPDTEFDNRYIAKLPPADSLKQMNISHVLYIVPDRSPACQKETDDLNDCFVNYQNSGIDIQVLPLTDFKAADSAQVQKSGSDSLASSGQKSHYYHHRPYYYGGMAHHADFFFLNYMLMRPSYTVVRTAPVSGFSAPSYRPAPRTTIFNRSISSARGIGMSRPSGFGTVTTRTSVGSGRISGIRAGGRGSFGRGGSFSG